MAAELLIERECEPRQKGDINLRVVEFSDAPGIFHPIIITEDSVDPVAQYLQKAASLSLPDPEELVILTGECLAVITIISDSEGEFIGHTTHPFENDAEACWWDFVRTPAKDYDKLGLVMLSYLDRDDFELLKQIFTARYGVYEGKMSLSEYRKCIEDKVGDRDDLNDIFVDIGKYLKELY